MKFVDFGFAVERVVVKDLWAIDRRGVVVVRFDRRAVETRDAPLAPREGIEVRNILKSGWQFALEFALLLFLSVSERVLKGRAASSAMCRYLR